MALKHLRYNVVSAQFVVVVVSILIMSFPRWLSGIRYGVCLLDYVFMYTFSISDLTGSMRFGTVTNYLYRFTP